MKIRPLVAEFFPCRWADDGRTDGHMTKLMVAFRNFAEAPNNNFCVLTFIEAMSCLIDVNCIVVY